MALDQNEILFNVSYVPPISGEELFSEIIEPSEESQTIEYNDEIKVTFPGGILESAKEVKIYTMTEYPELPDIYENETLYAIQVEDNSVFFIQDINGSSFVSINCSLVFFI